MLGALALALALQAPLRAQAPATADIRTVTAEVAEVRPQPSTKAAFYVTNRLGRGARVEVIEERPDGWLKIRPPQGSFSWINTRFLDHIVPHQPHHVIHTEDDVPVIVGSETIKDHRPDVVGVKLKRGTQVISIGPAQTDAEGNWMPIEPPPSEFRYVRADAVSARAPAAASSGGALTSDVRRTTYLAPPDGKSGALPATNAPNANPSPSPSVLYQQALQAERDGLIPEAVKLWAQVGAATVTTDPNFSREALRRAYWLHHGHQAYGSGPVRPAPEARYANTGAQPCAIASPPLVRASSAPATASVTPPIASAPSPWPTYRGRLSKAYRAQEGARTYMLELPNGVPFYVSPQPGIDLDPYIDRNLQVMGPIAYRPELRAWIMTVKQAQPLQ
jgi:hypothetical protein